MKCFPGLAAVFASLLLAFPAAAQQDPVAEKIKAELRRTIPEAQVAGVRKIAYGNLYEVLVGSEIFYTDDKASFLVLGSIVDLKTRENVTEARLKQVNRVAFDALPIDQAIKIVRGNGARKVAMFADPNCGYCKRFERDLLGVSDITVYVFLYPVMGQDSVQKSKAVWCAPDRGKAWIDYMARDMAVPVDTGCNTAVIDKNLEWGKGKRITGTPTMFFEDGERIPGMIPLAEFEKKLASASAPKAPAKVSAK